MKNNNTVCPPNWQMGVFADAIKTMDSNRTNISWWIFITESLWLYSCLASSSVWRVCTYKQPNKHANDLMAGYEQLWLETPYGLLALQKKSEPPAEKHLETYKYLHLITSHLEPTWTHYTLNTPSETNRQIFDQWILLTKGEDCYL